MEALSCFPFFQASFLPTSSLQPKSIAIALVIALIKSVAISDVVSYLIHPRIGNKRKCDPEYRTGLQIPAIEPGKSKSPSNAWISWLATVRGSAIVSRSNKGKIVRPDSIHTPDSLGLLRLKPGPSKTNHRDSVLQYKHDFASVRMFNPVCPMVRWTDKSGFPLYFPTTPRPPLPSATSSACPMSGHRHTGGSSY